MATSRRWIVPVAEDDAGAGAPGPGFEPDGATERDALRRIRRRLAEEIPAGGDGENAREAARRIVMTETAELPRSRREALLREVLLSLGGRLGPLQPLLDDPEVTEIMVNAPDLVYVERNGRLERADVAFRDDEDVQALVERVVGAVGRRFDMANPMVDARLPDGSRVNAIRPPLAIRGTAVTIRKFPRAFRFDELVENGTIPSGRDGGFDVAGALRWAVRNRLSVVVSGGTGTGKTTLLNALTGLIPDDERLIVIEDAAELQPQQPHVVRLESRPPNAEGKGEVRIRDLVKNALRMRPDRIIVGECRMDETIDMLQAMNTGHPGSMTTVHANSPRDALSRLETMVLMGGFDMPLRAVRQQIAGAVGLIVQIARATDADGRVQRAVTELCAVRGFDPETGDVALESLYRRPARAPGGDDVPAWARGLLDGSDGEDVARC